MVNLEVLLDEVGDAAAFYQGAEEFEGYHGDVALITEHQMLVLQPYFSMQHAAECVIPELLKLKLIQIVVIHFFLRFEVLSLCE